MKMTITKALVLIVGAPIAPVIIYIINEGHMSLSGIVDMTSISYALGLITFLISVIVCIFISRSRKGLVSSIIVSELLYVAVLLVYMLVIDEKNKAENMMWLPVMIIFMIPFTLPMPIAISYGTRYVLIHWKNRNMKKQ